MPEIRHVVETAIYVDDLARSVAFYGGVLGLRTIFTSDRLIALDAGRGTVLLVFRRGWTREGMRFDGGWIPPHDGAGESHFAFAVDASDVDDWRDVLARSEVEVESEVSWPAGGTSLYVRDPDGHSVELATPGVWPVY